VNPIIILTYLLTILFSLGQSRTAAQETPATPTSTPVVTPKLTQTNWSANMYVEAGARYQDPDLTACTAASALMALNMIALGGNAGSSFAWSATTDYAVQESILAFEKANDTLPLPTGSDPHGVRNALNYYGWGSTDAGVYSDKAYDSFGAAAQAVVASIARTHKPAVIFPWYGSHTQLVTGYKVTGEDPSISDNFQIAAVYLTDPEHDPKTTLLVGQTIHHITPIERNSLVSVAAWRSGDLALRFNAYSQRDSTLRDNLDGQIGRAEWYGKFVIVSADN
jgi:hypothetical protein